MFAGAVQESSIFEEETAVAIRPVGAPGADDAEVAFGVISASGENCALVANEVIVYTR